MPEILMPFPSDSDFKLKYYPDFWLHHSRRFENFVSKNKKIG
jgi:hypothetical protein